MKQLTNKLQNESGATLVELLAALAILSIIVTSFLAFFVQAGKTNNMTTANNEATFLAQEEIEELIHLSEIKSEDFKNREITKPPYTIQTTITPKKINKTSEIKMNQVLVIVTEGGKTRAQMETWLPLKEENGS